MGQSKTAVTILSSSNWYDNQLTYVTLVREDNLTSSSRTLQYTPCQKVCKFFSPEPNFYQLW